jgi:FixJ family two-component response regulator
MRLPRIGEGSFDWSLVRSRVTIHIGRNTDGLTNEEIGKRLFLSPETIRTHVQKAMRKLEADTRTQAVALALRQSLIG